MKKNTQPRQSLTEFLDGEFARDPEFKSEFEKVRDRNAKRRGRPAKATTRRGQREMRFLAPPQIAEAIVSAAQADGRTVSNWLLQAARRRLESISKDT